MDLNGASAVVEEDGTSSRRRVRDFLYSVEKYTHKDLTDTNVPLLSAR